MVTYPEGHHHKTCSVCRFAHKQVNTLELSGVLVDFLSLSIKKNCRQQLNFRLIHDGNYVLVCNFQTWENYDAVREKKIREKQG